MIQIIQKKMVQKFIEKDQEKIQMCMQIPTDPDMCYRLWCQFSRYKQNLLFRDDIMTVGIQL